MLEFAVRVKRVLAAFQQVEDALSNLRILTRQAEAEQAAEPLMEKCAVWVDSPRGIAEKSDNLAPRVLRRDFAPGFFVDLFI